jgi:hypothetical protein
MEKRFVFSKETPEEVRDVNQRIDKNEHNPAKKIIVGHFVASYWTKSLVYWLDKENCYNR